MSVRKFKNYGNITAIFLEDKKWKGKQQKKNNIFNLSKNVFKKYKRYKKTGNIVRFENKSN